MNLQASATNPIADDGNRVAHRYKIFVPVRVTTAQGDVRVHLINISATGALAHHATPPARNSAIGIEVGDRMIDARIVWVDGARFGIAFGERLDQRTIDTLFAG